VPVSRHAAVGDEQAAGRDMPRVGDDGLDTQVGVALDGLAEEGRRIRSVNGMPMAIPVSQMEIIHRISQKAKLLLVTWRSEKLTGSHLVID